MKKYILIYVLLSFYLFRVSSQTSIPKNEKEDRTLIMSKEYWKIWNANVQKKIDQDIDKNRKADAVLYFDEAQSDSEVKIEQLSHDFIFGAHIFNFNQLGSKDLNDKYKNLYGTLFNSATIAFYWNKHEMQPNRPRYKEEYWDTEEYWNQVKEPWLEPHWRRPASDPVVEFCEGRGIRMHGHTFVWGNRRWNFPNWIVTDLMLPEEKAKMDELVKEYAPGKNNLRAVVYNDVYEKLSPSELSKMLPDFTKKITEFQEKRITDVANYYKGRIHSWDIVNESAKDYNAGAIIRGEDLCKSWYGLMPGEYDYKSLKVAKEVFPENVALNINDYFVGEAYPDQVKSLISRGCKIDIMGSQMHQLGTNGSLRASEGKDVETPQKTWDKMNTLSKAGVPIHMSEITIASPKDDEKGRNIQAVLTRNMFRLWFSIESVMGITWWNVVDDCGAAGESTKSGLFTRQMEPKPSFYALDNLVNNEWKTNKTIKLPKDKSVKFRGFKGKYRIIWTDKYGQIQVSEFYLKNDGDGF